MRSVRGNLEIRFHTDNGPVRWRLCPHAQLPDAFADVARDRQCVWPRALGVPVIAAIVLAVDTAAFQDSDGERFDHGFKRD